MKVNKKILIFAILIGLLTVLGLNYYMNNLSSVQANKISYSKVAIATNTIPVNVKITADMVTLKSIPTESVHPEAITSLDKVIGKTSNSGIVKGEQILTSRIVVDAEKANLAYRVPENMRAISIPTSEISGVGGFINVGDKIDILATYKDTNVNPVSTTYTQLQNIKVLAVGNVKQSAADKQSALPASITVLVKPAQAEVLVYALSHGTLHFTLRNPTDSAKVDLDFYNSTNFGSYEER